MRKNKDRYFLLSDVELEVKQQQVDDFIYLWEQGHPLREITRKLKLTHDVSALLCFDLSMNERIEPRANGVFDNLVAKQ